MDWTSLSSCRTLRARSGGVVIRATSQRPAHPGTGWRRGRPVGERRASVRGSPVAACRIRANVAPQRMPASACTQFRALGGAGTAPPSGGGCAGSNPAGGAQNIANVFFGCEGVEVAGSWTRGVAGAVFVDRVVDQGCENVDGFAVDADGKVHFFGVWGGVADLEVEGVVDLPLAVFGGGGVGGGGHGWGVGRGRVVVGGCV